MHPDSNDPFNPHDVQAQPGALQGFQNQGFQGHGFQGHGSQGFAQPQPHQHAHGQMHPHQHDPFAPAHNHAPGTIACPKCQQPTDSLKSYKMMSFLLFLFIGAWWRTKRVVACPGCMRSELLISTLINTVAANVLSPIVWIWHGVLFATTFGKGHSSEVIGYLR